REAVLIAPDPAHFRPRISWNHGPSVLENFRWLVLPGDREPRGKPALLQRLAGNQADDFGMVVVLAEMAQDQIRGGSAEILHQVIRHPQIGEVAYARHDSLLDGPRVRPDLQHVEIVIGLEHQKIRATQVILDGFRDVAEVGDNSDADALCFETEPHRIYGV